MSNRAPFPIETPKDQVHLLFAKLVGAGAANMVNGDSAKMGGGEIVSATRTGTGAFNLVFNHAYPQFHGGARPLHVGTTAGLQCRFTAIDPDAKTASVQFEVGAVATDPAAADTFYFALAYRNSGRNT
jgi:hypothetical protein